MKPQTWADFKRQERQHQRAEFWGNMAVLALATVVFTLAMSALLIGMDKQAEINATHDYCKREAVSAADYKNCLKEMK